MPIQKMVQTANEISRGNLDINDLELSNTSEIRLLEKTINTMKQNLKNDIQMMEEKTSLTTELNAARMSALQAQIQPHFLFNTLNTINRTAVQEKAEKTQELIHALSGIFRYNLENSKKVSLQNEIDFIEQYMHIQQSRFSDRITYRYICDCAIDTIIVPPLILQPLVENAVIHGLAESENGGEIVIEISASNKKTKICIRDTGVGTTDTQLRNMGKIGRDKNNSTHIGIENVINRMRLFYKGKASIDFSHNTPSGLKITLLIPSKENEYV